MVVYLSSSGTNKEMKSLRRILYEPTLPKWSDAFNRVTARQMSFNEILSIAMSVLLSESGVQSHLQNATTKHSI